MPFYNDGSWEVAVKDGAGVASSYSSARNFDIAGIPNEGTWEVSVKDEAGTQSAYSTPRNFTLASTSSISVVGIDSAESFGLATILQVVKPEGVATSEALGSPSLQSLLNLESILSQEVFGLPQVSSDILAVGIPSAEAFGDPTIIPGAVTLSPVGMGSSEAFGEPNTSYILNTEGIASQESLGVPSIALGAVYLNPQSIPSQEAFGQITTTVYVPIVGIASQEVMGLTRITYDLPGVIVIPVAPLYRVEILDLDGTRMDEVPFEELRYAYVLNEAGTCSFELNLQHPKTTVTLLDPGKRQIHIYRDGVLVWGGYLWAAQPDIANAKVRFAGEGYFSRLRYRHIDEKLVRENTDQLDIAWALINFTQSKTVAGYSGDLGIVRGNPSESSGVLRTRKYREWERVNIAEELISLTELNNGFDFDITPQKVWNTYFSKRGSDNGHVFELGKNIEDIQYSIDATQIVSEFSALGSGERQNRCIATVSHTTALQDYGLLQASEDFTHIRHSSTLTDKAQNRLGTYRRPLFQPVVTVTTSDPGFGEYGIGDTLDVRARLGYVDVDEPFRLVAMEVAVSMNGRETVGLTFDRTSV